MEEELISKKELLVLTGISYGSLYRWKRKQLIPEDWFIKKSTFTGPETFFPRARVLERITKIQALKEGLSLDDLAQTFAQTPLDFQVTVQKLLELSLLSPAVTGLALFQPQQILDFYGALSLMICDKLLLEGSLNLAETDSLLTHLLADIKSFAVAPTLFMYRKRGVTFSILTGGNAQLTADNEAKQIVVLSTAQLWETLKTKWRTEA